MEGIIYYIDCGNNDLYVGSTVETLGIRASKHKYNLKTNSHRKLYKTLLERDIELKLILYKTVIYHSRRQLRFFEECVRKELKANINEMKCFQSVEQRREYKKIYYKDYCKKKKENKILEII
jgi:hypothetical protein|tara:strand:- start:4930 stop:5295 length:366 start_codon:yes stop_codon:yes gene_type:complete